MAKNLKVMKQDAAEAISAACDFLYEAEQLRNTAVAIEEGHDDDSCEDAHRQVEVLRNVSSQKSEEAMNALVFAEGYFAQAQPKAKKVSKKLAVIRPAAN